ncbi:hypothetical protein [Burkholderia sp. SRS-25]|uniref:hypothetical protein n=1 Tax=Burkholderia sp. SRS-25 TaxID=2094190 RepID=UPI00140539B9|nr:hypothetical protein [Burkholderia sp. SRS-25]
MNTICSAAGAGVAAIVAAQSMAIGAKRERLLLLMVSLQGKTVARRGHRSGSHPNTRIRAGDADRAGFMILSLIAAP